jgi:glycosyltransferase involved in cell wall biosynthesis
MLSSLKHRVEELGIATSVRFAGRVDDMQQVYSSIDVLAMPSITEGLPLTLLEAMAAGVPVIASRVGEIPSVLSNGNGILIDVGDSASLAEGIVRLLDDQVFSNDISASARVHVVRSYSSSTMAAAYRQLYKELAP